MIIKMRTKNISVNTFKSELDNGGYELFLLPVPFFEKTKTSWSIGLCFLRWGIEIEVSDESE